MKDNNLNKIYAIIIIAILVAFITGAIITYYATVNLMPNNTVIVK